MTKSKHDVWCPNCGCVMKKRKGKFGEFYGCTGYPICKNTLSLRDAGLELEDVEWSSLDHQERHEVTDDSD